MSLTEQQNLENAYVMHTFGRKPIELVRGRGMEVEDAAGNTLLDFIAGIGVCSLGHCHPAVSGAVAQQAEKLMHVSNYYYIEGRGELARTLSALLNGGDADAPEPWQTFFANSGAEANECAIKLARLYARKHAADPQAAPRTIVVLDRSFHGRTLATLAATAQPAKQEAFQPLPGGFVHTPINDEAALTALFEQQGNDICAVMFECVQGESGVHPCTPEFLQLARRLADEHGALLLADEVQTGIYRTGTPFAFQGFGIVPDIVSMAKGIASGMPVGACAAKAHVAAAFEPGDHGTTFGGSCLAIAAATATLRTLAEGDFPAHIEEVGAYLRARLAELPQVTEVRGRGLMVACDLAEGLDAPTIVTRALDEGLLLNATGPRTLRFLPPLICEKTHIDTLMQHLPTLLA